MCKDFGFGQLKGSNTLSFEKNAEGDTILDDARQRRHRQSLGRLLWLDRLDIKNDDLNIKRLLRYLVGNPACNMIAGCLEVLGIAGTPQGSVLVMTDAGLETPRIIVTTLKSMFGLRVPLKTRGIPCTHPRSRTWFA